MKILFVIKRFSGTIAKDAVLQDFGREIRLAEELAKKHKVTILAGDHVKKETRSLKLHNMQIEIRPLQTLRFWNFVNAAKILAKQNDLIIGTTHPMLAFFTHLATKNFVYDLRDNYETYDISNFPFLRKGLLGSFLMRTLNNHLIKKSLLAICVSHALKKKIRKLNNNTIVVENGIESIFKPLNKSQSRKALKLPNKFIVTYIGHVSKERGADILLKAFAIVRSKKPDAILLLSGQVDKDVNIKQAGVVFRELAQRKQVVQAINSADVAVIPQPENPTAMYGFPYKLMEYMACSVPIVATATGPIPSILPPASVCISNPKDMANKILKQRKVNYKIPTQYTWQKLAAKLERALWTLTKH
jgi:glycosyltransferase involved in cell wall biosynthesis